MGVYLVAGVWLDKNGLCGQVIELRHGIQRASSKEEALGMFILESDAKGLLSNKSVVEASGWVYEGDE